MFHQNTLFTSFRADIHTEAVQAALAQHKEEKMALPMPTKRRSTYVQSPINTRTPPGETKSLKQQLSSGQFGVHGVPSPFRLLIGV